MWFSLAEPCALPAPPSAGCAVERWLKDCVPCVPLDHRDYQLLTVCVLWMCTFSSHRDQDTGLDHRWWVCRAEASRSPPNSALDFSAVHQKDSTERMQSCGCCAWNKVQANSLWNSRQSRHMGQSCTLNFTDSNIAIRFDCLTMFMNCKSVLCIW